MCLSGVLLLWSVRRQRSILERGRAAIARVTTTRRIRSEYKTSSVWVNYEFTTYSGATGKGRSSAPKNRVPAAGGEVVVLYDMDNPKRTALYPLQLVRVRRD